MLSIGLLMRSDTHIQTHTHTYIHIHPLFISPYFPPSLSLPPMLTKHPRSPSSPPSFLPFPPSLLMSPLGANTQGRKGGEEAREEGRKGERLLGGMGR